MAALPWRRGCGGRGLCEERHPPAAQVDAMGKHDKHDKHDRKRGRDKEEETEEEKRARRLAKKEAKRAKEAAALGGYSNEANPWNGERGRQHARAHARARARAASLSLCRGACPLLAAQTPIWARPSCGARSWTATRN